MSPIFSNLGKNNHLEGNIYKCSMLLLPSHLKCNLLIVYKTFFDVHGQGCDDAGSDDVPLDYESGL